jgi:hypothetical protein
MESNIWGEPEKGFEAVHDAELPLGRAGPSQGTKTDGRKSKTRRRVKKKEGDIKHAKSINMARDSISVSGIVTSARQLFQVTICSMA